MPLLMQMKHGYLYNLYVLLYIYNIVEWCKCHLFAFKHLFISSEAELMASDMFLAHNKNRLPCKSPKNPKSSSCCPWKHTHHQRHQRSRRYAEPYVPAPGRGDLVLNPGALREVSANPSRPHKRFNKSTIHIIHPRIQRFRNHPSSQIRHANSNGPSHKTWWSFFICLVLEKGRNPVYNL